MSQATKLFERAKNQPKNYAVHDLCTLLRRVGYELDHVTGSHHFFYHPMTGDNLNIQPRKGNAKPSQVREVVNRIKEHGLLEDDE